MNCRNSLLWLNLAGVLTHNKNISTVGTCDDDTQIRITVSGGALRYVPKVQGIYVKSKKKENGADSWKMTSGSFAIWWFIGPLHTGWMVGQEDSIGTTLGALLKRVDTKSILPYDGNGDDWLYSDRIILNRDFFKQKGEIKVELECTGKLLINIIEEIRYDKAANSTTCNKSTKEMHIREPASRTSIS